MAAVSKFEKFLEGMQSIKQYQPATGMRIRGNVFLVGDSNDPHFPSGARKHLSNLGFQISEDVGMFAFVIEE